MYSSFSDQIAQCRDGVVRNPFQGSDKKVLFICSMGILRSATAARIYARKYNTRSCGTWDDALIPITSVLVDWADELVFVNRENYNNFIDAQCNLTLMNKSVVVLDIPDKYEHMHPELIKEFEKQYEPL